VLYGHNKIRHKAVVKKENKLDIIKKILVPIEFTEFSQGVFNCAVQMASNSEAVLIVLSIINSRDIESVESIVSMGYDVDAEHYVEEIKKDRKQQLNKMADESKIDKERVKILFKIGRPVDEILKAIDKEAPDLVIMGTKGRSNLKNGIMGSVAGKVFKRSPVNILSHRGEVVKKSLTKKLNL
jgi:nucleotide-binding universal stress UspA family protein